MTSVRLKEYKETVESTKGKEILEDLAPYKYLPVVSQVERRQDRPPMRPSLPPTGATSR